MKSLKWLVLIVPILLFSVKVMAFDSMTDCNKTFKDSKVNGPLQNIFNNYTDTLKYSKILTDGTYTLCFEPTISFCSPVDTQCTSKNFTITAATDKPLLIYGLNLSASNSNTQTLLQLSGSDITLNHVTLTGFGAGTALKINAKDVTIDTANISKFANAIETTANSENVSVKNSAISEASFLLAGKGHIVDTSTLTGPSADSPTGTAIQIGDGINPTSGITIGASNTLTNFSTGISVTQNANAKITQNTFTNVANFIAFADVSVQSPILADWLGKHVSETDANKVDRIVGKLDLQGCNGLVEMYAKKTVGDDLRSHSTAICQISIADKDIALKLADATEHTITHGSCIFTCENFSEDLSTQITFAYTSPDNKTYPFTPMPIKKLSDFADTIIVAIGGVVPGQTTTGMNNTDGETAGPPIVVPEFQPPTDGGNVVVETAAKKDDTDGKAQAGDTTPPTSASDKVGSGSSGGCGGGQNIGLADVGSPLQFLLALIPIFAILPIGYRRW